MDLETCNANLEIQNLECEKWKLDHGTGTQNVEHRTKSLEYATQNMDHGTWSILNVNQNMEL